MKSVASFAILMSLGLLTSAVDASSRSSRAAWRDTFQSSASATEIESEEDFATMKARFSKAGIPAPVLESFRPTFVTGTIRYSLSIAKGGKQFRLTVTNATSKPLVLSSMTVAAVAKAFDADPSSMRRVTFSGKSGISLAPGATAMTDPVAVSIEDNGSMLVSMSGPTRFQVTPTRSSAIVTAPGDQTSAPTLSQAMSTNARPLVTAISTLAPASTRVIAALGDSITDGNQPTLGTLHSWPEQLYRRILARPDGQRYSVVNAGIGGNKLLSTGMIPGAGVSVLKRLDRDVLRIEGLSRIILLIGVNDISVSGVTPFASNPPLSSSELIAGYRKVIARAHARGVKVTIGTITPFGGSIFADRPEKQKVRDEVNLWIRTSGEPDGYVDFDAAVRDPSNPLALRPEFDSGDHLHPNEAGSRSMGDAVDLSILN